MPFYQGPTWIHEKNRGHTFHDTLLFKGTKGTDSIFQIARTFAIFFFVNSLFCIFKSVLLFCALAILIALARKKAHVPTSVPYSWRIWINAVIPYRYIYWSIQIWINLVRLSPFLLWPKLCLFCNEEIWRGDMRISTRPYLLSYANITAGQYFYPKKTLFQCWGQEVEQQWENL